MHITGNSTQHFVNTCMGKESEREYIHIYICMYVCMYVSVYVYIYV